MATELRDDWDEEIVIETGTVMGDSVVTNQDNPCLEEAAILEAIALQQQHAKSGKDNPSGPTGWTSTVEIRKSLRRRGAKFAKYELNKLLHKMHSAGQLSTMTADGMRHWKKSNT